MTNFELKPCPFCGGEAVAEKLSGHRGWQVWCKQCYANVGDVYGMDSAIRKWNRRTNDGT